MDLLPEDFRRQWQAALADQAAQDYWRALDERIARFKEHCRRCEGQRARRFMERHRTAIRADNAKFLAALREALGDLLPPPIMWRRTPSGWEAICEDESLTARIAPDVLTFDVDTDIRLDD